LASCEQDILSVVADAVGGWVEVQSAGTAQEAIDQALAAQPDLLLLDLDVEGNEGMSTVAKLRDNAFMQPVIVLSSSPELPAEDGESPTFSSLLTKPLTREDLLGAIGGYLCPQLISETSQDSD
jgi:CheY-like chemotaxis protein